jgi:membrane fusion protein (multidrug efflux system)
MNTLRDLSLPGRPKTRLLTGIGLLIVLGLVAWGIVQRHDNVSELRDIANEDSIPPVQVMSPRPGPATREITLPGNIRAWYSAPIYAQVSGYVLKWYKDYGAVVKAGELLATIDAPAVDEQYESAQANLDVARTNYNLAVVTAKRWTALAGTEAVSQQEVDVQVANAAAQKAQARAAEHQVARYKVLEGFKNIVAPFDGVVTSRNTDVGNYVNAAGGDVSSHGAADELFSVSDIHEMRVFVSVPQDYSSILKSGLTATLSLPQYPGRKFEARFETTANAFNPQTRTVVTEHPGTGVALSRGRHAGRTRRTRRQGPSAGRQARPQSWPDRSGHCRSKAQRPADCQSLCRHPRRRKSEDSYGRPRRGALTAVPGRCSRSSQSERRATRQG